MRYRQAQPESEACSGHKGKLCQSKKTRVWELFLFEEFSAVRMLGGDVFELECCELDWFLSGFGVLASVLEQG
jgi:hypothetical protein